MAIEFKDAPRVVLVLLVLGIFLFVGALTFEQLQISQETNRVVVNNTPAGQLNFTTYATELSLAHNSNNESFFRRITNSTVVLENSTDRFTNTDEDTSAFTVNVLTGKVQIHDNDAIKNASQGLSDDGVFNVSYTWVEGNRAIDSLTSSQSAITNISNFQGTIGTVLAAIILIGLVFGALLFVGKGDKRRGGL